MSTINSPSNSLLMNSQKLLGSSQVGQKSILKSVGQSTIQSGLKERTGLTNQQSNPYAPNDSLQHSSINTKYGSQVSGSKGNQGDLNLARSMMVLSVGELQSIKDRAKFLDQGSMSSKDSEKKRLHEISLKRIENWPDSLLSLTQNKQKERYERFEKIELEKRKIDEQEEALKQEKYKQLIKEANQKIFEQDPRVRQFQKKVLLLDVIEERKEQQLLAKHKEDILKSRGEYDFQFMMSQKQAAEEEEKRKNLERTIKQEKVNQQLHKQLNEAKDKRIKEIIQDNTEGQWIKEKAIEEQADNEQKRQNQKQKKKNWLHDIEETKMKNTVLFNTAQQQQQAEQQKLEEYLENKGTLMQMRKKREQSKMKEKIAILDHMYDVQLKKLHDQVDNEEERIAKQIKELQQKEDEIQANKEKDLQRRREIMKQSIKESIELKEKLEAEKQRKEKEYAEQLLQQSRIIKQEEQEEKVFQLKRKYDIRNYQLTQAEQKKQLLQERYGKELEEDTDLRNSNLVDKRIFKTWADQQIQEAVAQGRSQNTLVKELKLIQSRS